MNADTDLFFSPGGDLSVRYYPWRLSYLKPRPYGGISVNTMLFGLESEMRGDRYDGFVTTSLLGGVAFAFKDWQVNAEWMWRADRQRTFFSDRATQEVLQLPRHYFSFGLVRYVDFTLQNEANKISGRTEKLHQALKKDRKVNSISVGLAPSSAFFLKSPLYGSGDRRSLPDHRGEVMWEFGLGYLLHNEGVHLGFSYRDYTSSVESYGLEHLFRRRSVALEALFFLLDYNGFVPFVGPSVSYERWGVAEFEGNRQVGNTRRTGKVSPGLVFGWDIVPSPIDTWVLRTNLRYYPLQRIEDVEGKKSRVDQFEFNFIQFVLYPNRVFHVARAKKKF